MLTIDELLRLAVARKASDVHLTVGLPPLFRIDGELTPQEGEPLSEETARGLAYAMLDDKRIRAFEETKELDTSYSVKGLSRFRVNLYRQRGSVGACIRLIPFQIPTLEELRLPDILKDFAERPSGLFIVSGPTGSGKSTTLAAMIQYLNDRKNSHILTVEDPIEYLHQHKKATVNQRELGSDTDSFNEALRHAVRQDPNIVLIGEMRDLETMTAALTLAETGHLIFGTLHTSDAMHAITRIVDVFPPYQQTQVRVQLSLVLTGVLVQQLIPKATGEGRVVACELMSVTPAVGNIIRENQLQQLRSSLQTGRSHGMCTMNQSLADLHQEKLITWEEASKRSQDVEELRRLIQSSPKR